MNSIPGRKRFRPILRMNDLLHPIQQRERMAEFASPQETNTYSAYPRVWVAGQSLALLVIKAPSAAKRLDEETYLVLLQKRVSWMMQCWLQDLKGSQADLEHLLNRTITQFHPDSASETVPFSGDDEDWPSLKQWCSEWAETIVQESDRITDLLHLEGIQFPVATWDSSHPQFQETCDLHNETDLETWLTLLMTI